MSFVIRLKAKPGTVVTVMINLSSHGHKKNDSYLNCLMLPVRMLFSDYETDQQTGFLLCYDTLTASPFTIGNFRYLKYDNIL